MKKEFYDKQLYTISNYIFGFIQSSLYFAVCNILLILFFIFTTIVPNQFNLLILFICLIPLGPSLGALYSTIGKIICEKDIFFSSHFWNFYKDNFVSYLKLWLAQLIIITVLFIDFQYFYLNVPEKGIHIIFAILIIITLLINLYSFPINSKFELRFKDLLILSIHYMIKKFPITILKSGAIVLSYYLSNNVSITFLIFMPSVLCLIFFYYDRHILMEIENKFGSSNETTLKSF
ncbi:YesL family protein [Clostridium sp.]|uniref:YesL family protein n=1 Tax=Clostridium sp. TaxID=1506 RepID=UPI0028424139|nr:YesL family protein [Clostridium sp.]MDR3598402.1 YesL family protein [Clostridium sp.]